LKGLVNIFYLFRKTFLVKQVVHDYCR
jgi:hypothetical protein